MLREDSLPSKRHFADKTTVIEKLMVVFVPFTVRYNCKNIHITYHLCFRQRIIADTFQW